MLRTSKRQSALALIALIVQHYGNVNGRTKLQKLCYLANMTGWDCLEDYRFHYYGPFSDSLTDYVEEMRELGWLKESPVATDYGNTLYEYSVGKESMASALIAKAGDQKLVSKTNGLLTQLEPFTSDQLEIMSSLVFLYENEHLEGEELIGRTKELKPRFSESQIRECTKIFKILGNFLPRYRQHIPV